MDIEGTRKARYAYRSPRLAVAVRAVEVRVASPGRQGGQYIDIMKPQSPVASTVTVVRVDTTPAPAYAPAPVVGGVLADSTPATESAPVKPKTKNKKPRKKLSRFQKVMYGSAATVVAVGVLLAFQAYMANTAVEIQVKKLQAADAKGDTSSGTSSLPSDEKPKDPNYLQNYKVAPQLPQLLTISKIGVSARVLQVGVDSNNQMEVPKTAYDVAWYNGSSRPGENGAMVIDGHVQGVAGPAIFSNLKKLAAGDTITVQRGDGKQFTYTVVKTETIPVGDVDTGKLLVSADTNKPGLNLITCAGSYDQSADQFDSRTIVYAVQQ